MSCNVLINIGRARARMIFNNIYAVDTVVMWVGARGLLSLDECICTFSGFGVLALPWGTFGVGDWRQSGSWLWKIKMFWRHFLHIQSIGTNSDLNKKKCNY